MAISSKFRLGFFLIVVLALAIYFLTPRLSQSLPKVDPKDIDQELEFLLMSCSNTSQFTAASLNYKCVKSGLTAMTSKANLAAIIDSLENIFLKKETNKKIGTISCHGPAHLLGEIAVTKGISQTAIMDACDRRCDYGCIHGAFLQMIRETPNFLDTFPSVCSRFQNGPIDKDLTSCYHITGHGLTDLTGRDVQKTMSYCNQFADSTGQNNCMEGVIMEVVLGTSDDSEPFDVVNQDLVEFCRQFPDKYSPICYENIGFYAYSLMEQKEDAAKICHRVPTAFQKGCFRGLGTRAYFAYRSSLDSFYKYCDTFGRFRTDCLYGEIIADVDFDPEFKRSIEICSREEDIIDRDLCFSFLGDRLEYAHGQEFRQVACANFDKIDSLSCLKSSIGQ